MPITKGFATYLGTIVGFLAYVAAVEPGISASLQAHGAPAWVTILAGIAMHSLVLWGRYNQAHGQITNPPVLDDTEHAEELPAAATDVPADQV